MPRTLNGEVAPAGNAKRQVPAAGNRIAAARFLSAARMAVVPWSTLAFFCKFHPGDYRRARYRDTS